MSQGCAESSYPPCVHKRDYALETVCSTRLEYMLANLAIQIRNANTNSGVAHEAEEDQYYGGVFINKGSRIIPLEWYVSGLIEVVNLWTLTFPSL